MMMTIMLVGGYAGSLPTRMQGMQEGCHRQGVLYFLTCVGVTGQYLTNHVGELRSEFFRQQRHVMTPRVCVRVAATLKPGYKHTQSFRIIGHAQRRVQRVRKSHSDCCCLRRRP